MSEAEIISNQEQKSSCSDESADQDDNVIHRARDLVNHVALRTIKQSTSRENDIIVATGLTIAITMATTVSSTQHMVPVDDHEAMKITAQIFCGKSDLIGNHFDTMTSMWLVDLSRLSRDSKQCLAKYYDCVAQRLPVTKQNNINARQFQQKLRKVHKKPIQFNISPDAITREAVLTNSVHIASEWREPFTQHLTTDRKFKRSEHEIVQAATMTQKSGLVHVTCDVIRCDVIEVPLKARRMSVLFYRPHESGGLGFLQKHFTVDNFCMILQQLKNTKPQPVHFSVPKFVLSRHSIVDSTSECHTYQGIELLVNEHGLNVPLCCTAHEQALIGPAIHDGLRWTTINMDKPFMLMSVDMASGMIFFVGQVSTPQLNVARSFQARRKMKKKRWCF